MSEEWEAFAVKKSTSEKAMVPTLVAAMPRSMPIFALSKRLAPAGKSMRGIEVNISR